MTTHVAGVYKTLTDYDFYAIFDECITTLKVALPGVIIHWVDHAKDGSLVLIETAGSQSCVVYPFADQSD